MSSIREMRLRIKSIKNLSQVTRALETVSASKVRRSMQAAQATKPYAEKAWQVLIHLASQPIQNVHPLLGDRKEVNNILVLLISSDRGLAGSYNVNIVRQTLLRFNSSEIPVKYIAVGRKGRDMLFRRRKNVLAEFCQLPSPPTFMDVSSIGRLAVDQFLIGNVDQVHIAYTDFHTMLNQEPIIRQLLPLKVDEKAAQVKSVYAYEPGEAELLDQIVPRFTALQIYQAILTSQASEHAARMVSMRNATDNALELISFLQLQYNKARQQSITSDMLDIVGGAEAQTV